MADDDARNPADSLSPTARVMAGIPEGGGRYSEPHPVTLGHQVAALEARVAELETRAAREDERLAALQERNRIAITREHDRLARHGLRPCSCDPGQGCNAP